jgi:hypothetical protein
MKKLYRRRRVWVYSDEREPSQFLDPTVMEDQKIINKSDLFCNELLVDHYDTYLFIADIPDEDIKVLNKYDLLSDL